MTTPSDMPEVIWAEVYDRDYGRRWWPERCEPDDTQYIRADLVRELALDCQAMLDVCSGPIWAARVAPALKDSLTTLQELLQEK